MTSDPTPLDGAIETAEEKLARLDVQVEAVQALLVRLLQDVVHAESRLASTEPGHLMQVNEQLVVSAINTQVESEIAAKTLAFAAQSAALDPLTRLPNRTALNDRFLQAIANAKRRSTQFALLFVDLDGFKTLNDTHGHLFDDKVLQLVADRMLAVVREVDSVSRHGGDEFLILLGELTRPEDAATVAEKLVAAVGADASIDGRTINVTASVGIAIYPDDGEDFDTLVSRADAAMYQTKRRRPGGVAFHGATSTPEADLPPGHTRVAHGPVAVDRSEAASDQLNVRLRQANEKLVLAVLSAQQLQTAAELAQRRQAAFMDKVAEELLNPAAPIRVVGAMLGLPSPDEPMMALLPRVQGIVAHQVTQIAQLIDALSNAPATEKRALELDLKRTDLRDVIDVCIANHRPMLAEREQRFEARLPTGALEVQGDPMRLELIIGNLLDNACTHTQLGGWIRLAVATSAGTLTLTVSDNGLGVTPQTLPYVFEPFVQDTHNLSFNGLGLGIGLTVARALARAHGGDLVASSAGASRGTALVLTLPLADLEARP